MPEYLRKYKLYQIIVALMGAEITPLKFPWMSDTEVFY